MLPSDYTGPRELDTYIQIHRHPITKIAIFRGFQGSPTPIRNNKLNWKEYRMVLEIHPIAILPLRLIYSLGNFGFW